MNAALPRGSSPSALFALGYRFYSSFLSRRIFQLAEDEPVPARESSRTASTTCPPAKHVLWGHHYTSIAGAAPIVGPAIAVIWGWLPALLWVAPGHGLHGRHPRLRGPGHQPAPPRPLDRGGGRRA